MTALRWVHLPAQAVKITSSRLAGKAWKYLLAFDVILVKFISICVSVAYQGTTKPLKP